MKTTQDRILQKQNRLLINRFYVPIAPGNNGYFRRYSQAHKFAKYINSEVKPLD